MSGQTGAAHGEGGTEGIDAFVPGSTSGRWRPLLSRIGSKEATHGIYIEIVVLAIILALEGKRASDSSIVVSVFGALVAVVLAELYAYYIGTMIGTGRRPTGAELKQAMVGTGVALVATVPSVFLLMLGVVGVIRLENGFSAAKWAGVIVMGLYSLLASRRAGLSMRLSLLTAASFALIGFGLVLLKQYFH
jgi:hypothetical protein